MIANQRMGRLDCHTSATTNKLECLTFPTGGKYWLDGANRENIESENIYIYTVLIILTYNNAIRIYKGCYLDNLKQFEKFSSIDRCYFHNQFNYFSFFLV